MNMRAKIFFLLFSISGISLANDTIRFGSKVLNTRDPVSRVLEIAGTPDNKVKLLNEYGLPIGERWEYYQKNKTIQVIMYGGMVVEINEIR